MTRCITRNSGSSARLKVRQGELAVVRELTAAIDAGSWRAMRGWLTGNRVPLGAGFVSVP
jgi:hypothetical protein